MIKKSRYEHIFNEHKNVLNKTRENCLNDLIEVAIEIAKKLSSGSTLFICGNGGSASDSQHLAAELIGRFKKPRRALKAISLNTDTSALTCISNDYSYDQIFSRQLEGLAKKDDLLLVLSTSGKSKNILKALKVADKIGMNTISFLGKGGGDAKSHSIKSIIVPSNSTARIQEMHILLAHIMCEIIEEELGIQ